jgi:hypothetical protein
VFLKELKFIVLCAVFLFRLLLQVMGKHVLIYDGECVMCDSTVRWLAERDEHRQIVFASRASR